MALQALVRILLQMELQMVAILVVVDIRTLSKGKWMKMMVSYLVIMLVFRKV